ncbi:50S ribosomal protein L18 [Candidatus Pacearchaeota archaeon]|nr:50S ribosomal protein L18 [Candidatus Pacearchaeota archaeon]
MKIDKRRRIENKTNYNKRLKLLKGNSPRLVIRKTDRYIILQIIESFHAQDKVIAAVTTKDLLKYGWPEDKSGSLKCLTAAYLAGFLLGKKANLKGRAVLDTGLIPNTKGSRIYAGVKGYLDSGKEIECNEEVIPTEETIKGNKEKIMKEVLSSFEKTLEKSGLRKDGGKEII